MCNGHGIVLIGAKPRHTAIESAANVAAVVVEDYVFAICSAGELHRGNLYFRGFMAWDAGVGDCDSPQHRGFEIARRRDRVDVTGFVTDLVGDARIVGNYKGER